MDISDEERTLKGRNYDNLALKTFTRGQLQLSVRLRNPNSLKNAIALVVEVEKFLCCQNLHNNIKQNNFKPWHRITPTGYLNLPNQSKLDYFHNSSQNNKLRHFNTSNNYNKNYNKPNGYNSNCQKPNYQKTNYRNSSYQTNNPHYGTIQNSNGIHY